RGDAGMILKRTLQIVALPAILIAIWAVTSANAGSEQFYYSTPNEVWTAFRDTWFGSRLTDDVLPSVLRLLGGYAVALVVGVGLGVPIGLSRTLRALVEPLLEFFRAIPPPVLVPLLILLSGA